MFKKSKIVCLIATFLLGILPFITAGTSVYAAENDNLSSLNTFEQELINQYAEDLEFIYENAAVVDKDGNIEQVNLTVLREKYGNTEFFDYLENDFGPSAIKARGNFGNCMKNEFGKIIGLDIAKQIFSPQVKKLLANKSWRKASEVIVKTLGKKVGKKVLKKLVSKMVPEGLPAQIIFSAGKCGIKARL